MTNYVKRLLYVDAGETQRVNILVYPFLFASLVYGFGFATLGWWSGVSSSSLFQAFAALHGAVPIVWGVCALIAGLLAVTLLLVRRNFLGETAAMFGFLVWLFAGFTYALNGFWLVLFSVAIPNIYFWVYYYLGLKGYERRKRNGLIVDP